MRPGCDLCNLSRNLNLTLIFKDFSSKIATFNCWQYFPTPIWPRLCRLHHYLMQTEPRNLLLLLIMFFNFRCSKLGFSLKLWDTDRQILASEVRLMHARTLRQVLLLVHFICQLWELQYSQLWPRDTIAYNINNHICAPVNWWNLCYLSIQGSY